MARQSASIFSRDIALAAVRASFPKLDPRSQVRNPVMFIVELGSVITTVIFILDLARGHTGQLWFVAVIAVWLWLTVLFANFAEAILKLEGPYNQGLLIGDVPVDAVTTSASGIDPDISPAYAALQSRRIAAVRHLPLATVQQLIEQNTAGRSLGFFGEPGVNVLKLNLALDQEQGA